MNNQIKNLQVVAAIRLRELSEHMEDAASLASDMHFLMEEIIEDGDLGKFQELQDANNTFHERLNEIPDMWTASLEAVTAAMKAINDG